MARKSKRSRVADTTSMAARRVTRAQSRRDRAVVATSATFVSTIVAHEGIFSDRLISFLATDDLTNVCTALEYSRVGRGLLSNATLWTYATTRDGLAGGSTVTPPPLSSPVGCRAHMDYLCRRRQLECFDTSIFVLAGDLERITEVGGVPVDCLAFPTLSSFFNPRIGVAGCVHRRMAKDLSASIRSARQQQSQAREVLTTPGNGADINLLVHCVGPSQFDRERRAKLYTTYAKALAAIQVAQNVHCAAFASISTGTLGYPKEEAADIAMAAVRDSLRAGDWPRDKRVAFVCLDNDVLKDFTAARAAVRRSLFTSSPLFPPAIQEVAPRE